MKTGLMSTFDSDISDIHRTRTHPSFNINALLPGTKRKKFFRGGFITQKYGSRYAAQATMWDAVQAETPLYLRHGGKQGGEMTPFS